MGDTLEIHEMVLNFSCFLHYYSGGRATLPHPVTSDFLYESSNETGEGCALVEHIHKIFGGLLLDDFNETNGYYGWRPAHSLISEVVKSRMNIEDTAILLLVVGFYEVRTRYSPLLMDVLEGDNGIRGALKLLINICQKASQTEEKAYVWQQLARFMGYEMRAKEMDPEDSLHNRLHSTMSSNLEEYTKFAVPQTGIETAHVAVDIAINQQPKYSHHYVTKGVLYLLQLRDFMPEDLPNLHCSMPTVIDICRKALEVYDKALSTSHALNHYSMIGKIQAIISLLQIVKGVPCFRLESKGFTRYLKNGEIPKELTENALKPEDHNYVQGLSTTALDLFNELFRDVKL